VAAALPQENCYGVALKGQNDCAAAQHSCARLATVDYDGQSWKAVPKGTCTTINSLQTSRKATHTWFDNTLRSRLNDKTTGCIVIVAQRLHQDDLVGHVLDQEDWEVVSFQAVAQVDECHLIDGPLGRRFFQRKAGDVLHPSRESAASLAKTQRAISSFNFASQYQQSPIPLGGAIVKTEWLRYYEPGEQPADFWLILQSWDTANKSGELNDYSVCTTWGVTDEEQYYLLDVCRKRLNFPDLKREVVRQAERYGPYITLVEDKASGTQLIQDLANEAHVQLTPYTPPSGADKIMRLHSQTASFENGRILLPREAPWLHDYIAEITGFPGSRFADQVDSTTQALDYLRNNDDSFIWIRMAARERGSTRFW
jgi:predicted phage terminase large subunit-like protein